MTIARSVLDAVGRTPLVELARLTRAHDGRIVAKLDFLNPGGSKKDRMAMHVIEEAERTGELRQGQTVVELTSGNAGTGLAIVCAVKGYPFVAVMSRGNSVERATMMAALGAEVIVVDQAAGSTEGEVSGEDLALVDGVATAVARERGAFRVDQFRNPANRAAHERTTGAELWEQAGGDIDAFCDFVGSGGTLAGVTAALKARNPRIACYAVEPATAAALQGCTVTDPHHRIQGGGYAAAQLPLLDLDELDGYVSVTDGEAIDAARRLAREEGIFAGFSSGANAAAALRLLQGEQRGRTVAIVLADSGLKYLSTGLWADRRPPEPPG